MTITARADFDSGSIRAVEVQGRHLILHPVPYAFNGWPTGNWFYVLIEGAEGKDLEVSFATDACDLHGFKAENKLSMSRDGVRWETIPDSVGEGNAYRCVIRSPSDRFWLSLSTPYAMGRVSAKVAEWLTSPWVKPTRSAGANGCIQSLAGGVWRTAEHGTGTGAQSIPPLPLYAVDIGDADLPLTAPHVVLFGGNHAGEHLSNYVLESLVDWWISDANEAAALRRSCRCLVYPMVNPAGRYGGYVRGGPEFPMGDHNRIWSPEDRGQLPHVDRLKDALASDVQGPVEFFLDAHNTERAIDTFMYVNTTMMYREDGQRYVPLVERMFQDVPNFRIQPTESLLVESQNTTCKSWAAVASDGPKARYSYTLEPGSPARDQVETCRHYGESLGRGLFDHFCGGA